MNGIIIIVLTSVFVVPAVQSNNRPTILRHRNPARHCFVSSPQGCMSFAQCCLNLCRDNASIVCNEKAGDDVVSVDKNSMECKCGGMVPLKPGARPIPLDPHSKINNRHDVSFQKIVQDIKTGRRSAYGGFSGIPTF